MTVVDFPASPAAPEHRIDVDAALSFLSVADPAGPWAITLIPVERGQGSLDVVLVKTRGSADAGRGDLERALERNQRGTHNAYWSPNPSPRAGDRKATEDDIDHAVRLWVDCDPRPGEDLLEEQARLLDLLTDRLPKGVPAPTAVVFSGGGYQALWQLAEPVALDGKDGPATLDVKARASHLEVLFGADDCRNVDRVLRLPGSINWPSEQKRKKGRVAALARLVGEYHAGLAYPLSAFTPMSVGGPAAIVSNRPRVELPGEVRRLAGVEELDRWSVPDRVKVAIVQGQDPDRPLEKDNSRSGWVFYVACQLVRAGVPDEVIFSVLTDPSFDISESILTHVSGPRKYGVRQIEKARATVALDDAGWVETTKQGDPVKSYRNTLLAVARLGVECRWNTFRNRLILESEALGALAGELNDNACVRLRQLIIDTYGFDPGKEHVGDAAKQHALSNPFNPVVDYLETTQAAWDGTERLGGWLTTYLGAPEDELTRAIGRATLVAAVRRARSPGCKFDFITVLEGPQGSGKSSALRVLAGDDDVFSDAELLHLDGRGQMEAVQGVWIYELGELAGLRAADVEKVKAFASRTHDRARAAYERFTSDLPRCCIFVGTTNKDDYLRDATGNRRFWPVPTTTIDLAALRRDRDQLWAEAATVEAEGDPLGLPESLWETAAEVQRDRVAEDSWTDVLRDVSFQRHTHGRKRVLTEALYRLLKIEPRDQTPATGQRLRAVMERLGWTKAKIKLGKDDSRWGYVAPLTDDEARAMTGGPRPKELF